MVFFTFSQQWAKERHEERVRKLWNKVITASTSDLWVKVFFYRDKIVYHNLQFCDISEQAKAMNHFASIDSIELQHCYPSNSTRGTYRCAESMGHGFYDKEWNFIQKHTKINHCITLKLGESIKDDSIVSIMAHEYRHYRQWKKYGAYKMNTKANSTGKRPIQVERDAKDWAKKRTHQLGYKE